MITDDPLRFSRPGWSSVIMGVLSVGVAEQIPRPRRPGPPADRRVAGPALLRPARRPGSFV